MQGRVHEVKSSPVPPIELRPTLILAVAVDVEIVPDDINGASGEPFGDMLKKRDERGPSPSLDDMTQDLACADVEPREQAACPVAHVLKLFPHRSVWLGLGRVLARQC